MRRIVGTGVHLHVIVHGAPPKDLIVETRLKADFLAKGYTDAGKKADVKTCVIDHFGKVKKGA